MGRVLREPERGTPGREHPTLEEYSGGVSPGENSYAQGRSMEPLCNENHSCYSRE